MRHQKWVLAGIFAFYALVLVVTAIHHEPWFDEAQSWLLARDSSWWNLFVHRLKYEGTPGLWHALLKILQMLGLPYASMTMLAVASALCATAILLWKSPFPLWAKALLPFGFYLSFQYAVVARSYVLLPPLLFGIASVYDKRLQRPLLFYGLLALLSQVSLHGMLLCGSLLLMHCADAWRDLQSISSREKKMHLAIMGMLIGLCVLTAAILLPPADLDSFVVVRSKSTVFAVRGMVEAFGGTQFLSAVILGLSIPWLFLYKRLNSLMILLTPLLLLFALKYANPWHYGILFLCWLFCVWLALAQAERKPIRKNTDLFLSLLLLCVLHVWWGVNTIVHDIQSPYSGSKQVAEYIRSNHLEESTIAADSFHTFSILPYFQKNLWMNYNSGKLPAYWKWQKNAPFTFNAAWVQTTKPEVIILTVKQKSGAPYIGVIPPEYHLDLWAPGSMYWKAGVYELSGFQVYRKSPTENMQANAVPVY